ncbi:hypothetical protein MANES_04G058040v8 [Manihot esculenta]|uniref:Uncharacterized protein n=1 Tax=Manihot esculenta TaxID=3983 RepID=A0ACB7HU07_MANES|nr:hypothetical protein MANES_04G058040v8 [Manihot esculenta]
MAQPPSANDLIIQLTAQLDQAELQGRVLIGEGYDNTNVGQHGEWRFCVVGRLFSDRAVNFDAFQHTMAIAWRPDPGMFVKELDNNVFIF